MGLYLTTLEWIVDGHDIGSFSCAYTHTAITIMPSDISSYLASRYLVADPKPQKKKRKRKDKDTNTGLLITDDDDSTWGTNANANGEDGDDAPLTVLGAASEFRKTKKSNWKATGTSKPDDSTNDGNDDNAVADAIIASVAQEQQAARDEDDDVPMIDDSDVVKMSDGTYAGLQSAAAVTAQLKLRQREEQKEFERHRKTAKEAETVYRDATGRRIDISMKRAEARRLAAEAEEKERQKTEALKGDVQMQEAKRRREQLEDAKVMSFARGADDENMNQELKEKERWNDPMMQFIAEKKQTEGVKKGNKRRPVYPGAAPPNRYGIKPGYRWDGVDRGNGFEQERFKAINRKERSKGLEYSWQMDE